MSDGPDPQPRADDGLFRWLGRQVGHVRAAVRPPKPERVEYRRERVEERPHPAEPGVTLRRTTVDEAVRRDAADPL